MKRDQSIIKIERATFAIPATGSQKNSRNSSQLAVDLINRNYLQDYREGLVTSKGVEITPRFFNAVDLNFSSGIEKRSDLHLVGHVSPFGKPLFENSLLGYKEAAQYLGICESYLRRLKRKGKIPFVLIGIRGVRFKFASLNAWIAEREIKK